MDSLELSVALWRSDQVLPQKWKEEAEEQRSSPLTGHFRWDPGTFPDQQCVQGPGLLPVIVLQQVRPDRIPYFLTLDQVLWTNCG